jgi:F-box protein 18 (helicase)
LDEARVYELTQSFRFPQRIADLASDILNEWKGDDVRIVGCGARNGVRSRAFIARTNSSILERAKMLVANGQGPIHFAGTQANDGFRPDAKYGFDELLDVYYLWAKQKSAVKTRYIARFKSFGEIKEMTENRDAQDADLKRMVGLVERWEDRLPTILSRLSASAVGPEEARITLVTGHGAKGLEWDSVEMGDDFFNLCDADLLAENMTEPEFDEEVNLLYVTGTRTRGELDIPQSLETWWTCYLKGEKAPRSEKMNARLAGLTG